MTTANKYRIDWRDTCWTCDLEPLAFQCTDELAPLDRFIGQDRAQEAIRFGLEVDKPGYNLFVTGLTGTGKTSAIKSQLQLIMEDSEWVKKRKPNSDWIYVYNFQDPDRPKSIFLPRGVGRVYSHQVNDVLRMLNEEVPKTLKSEEYEA